MKHKFTCSAAGLAICDWGCGCWKTPIGHGGPLGVDPDGECPGVPPDPMPILRLPAEDLDTVRVLVMAVVGAYEATKTAGVDERQIYTLNLMDRLKPLVDKVKDIEHTLNPDNNVIEWFTRTEIERVANNVDGLEDRVVQMLTNRQGAGRNVHDN